MTIEFKRPTEAFAAVAWVVCTADSFGSMEERAFLYGQVQNLAIFEDYSLVDFQYLLGATFNRLFPTLPNGEPAITGPSVGDLIQAVSEVLSPELRVEAFETAVGLANADKLCDQERTLLEQLQRGLEIDDKAAQDILSG